MGRRRVSAALVALGLLVGPGRGEAGEDEARPRPAIAHQASVSMEAALDTNARRMQTGPAVALDGLAYLFATGRIESRSPGRLFMGEADVGAKRFLQTAAEDTLVGRLGLRWVRAPRPGIVLGLEASYKDKLQRGDPWQEVEADPHLRCTPPSTNASSYRCNRRDYRHGAAGGSVDLRHEAWTLQGRAGASLLDYKPNRQFSYAGPDFRLSLGRPLGQRHGLRVWAAGSLRQYHPDSQTYRIVPSADRIIVEPQDIPRVERLYSGGLTWRFRGPVLVSTTFSLAASRNNSDGMDVVRGRLEVAGAYRLGESTTLVASAAFQLAHYPEGNVFSRLALVADEDERQNALAIQMTHRLNENLAVVIKAQAYANEFSGDALPFRRQVFHGGLRWSL